MKKRVLITGGAGFIGSRIAKNCIEQGVAVRIFDLTKSSLPGVEDSIVGSILDPYEVSLAARGCDSVIHAAAALGVQRTESKRLECLYINIQGTINVMDAAVKERLQKIVFISSSEVYGDAAVPVYQETSPLNPKSNYAITKLVGEEYARAYHQSYGVNYAIVRLFSVYGEGQSNQFVIPKFAEAVARGSAPTLYGDGQQLRSFCHVDDAARGTVAALLSDRANSEIINLGNDTEPVTMQDLANKVIKIGGKPMEPQFVGFEKSDRTAQREIYKRTPSIAKARELLNYAPKISLDEGLQRVLKHYQAAFHDSVR